MARMRDYGVIVKNVATQQAGFYAAGLALLMPSMAGAHSFSRYVSTPITPPLELLWVAAVYVVLFLILNVPCRKWFLGEGLLRSTLFSVALLTSFSLSFFCAGTFAASMSTAPPPGLGFSHPAFWGFDWEKCGDLFQFWNSFGLVALFGWSWFFLRPGVSKNRKRWVVVCANLVLYLLCLLPFAVSGAWMHGRSGYYVNSACNYQVESLNSALIAYAEDHGGKLPEADSLDAVLALLVPSLSEIESCSGHSVDLCPLGAARERHPKRYEWNPAFSGVSLETMKTNPNLQGILPISCPYHDNDGKPKIQ